MTSVPLPVLLGEPLEVEMQELVRATGLHVDEIVELVEYGVFEPSAGGAPAQWRFSARSITAWIAQTPPVAQRGAAPSKTAQRPRISWQSNRGLSPSIASTTSSTVMRSAGRARR